MSMLDLVRVEFKLVYGDLFRRKSAFITFILYPYIFTSFTLFIGYAVGSPRGFVERVGVDPVIYMITASYMLMSIFSSIDDLLWRPLLDLHIGTLPYIIASPVNRLKYYTAIPIPRLVAVLLLGFTSILPVYILYYGLEGVAVVFVVISILIVGCLTMVFFSIALAMSIHRVGESWRMLNIVRPVLMILMGVYYPRMFMPLASYILSSFIPSSHAVEAVQRFLMGMSSDIYILIVLAIAISFIYMPIGKISIREWEKSRVRRGVETF